MVFATTVVMLLIANIVAGTEIPEGGAKAIIASLCLATITVVAGVATLAQLINASFVSMVSAAFTQSKLPAFTRIMTLVFATGCAAAAVWLGGTVHWGPNRLPDLAYLKTAPIACEAVANAAPARTDWTFGKTTFDVQPVTCQIRQTDPRANYLLVVGTASEEPFVLQSGTNSELAQSRAAELRKMITPQDVGTDVRIFVVSVGGRNPEQRGTGEATGYQRQVVSLQGYLPLAKGQTVTGNHLQAALCDGARLRPGVEALLGFNPAQYEQGQALCPGLAQVGK